jgi:hypothetical protein
VDLNHGNLQYTVVIGEILREFRGGENRHGQEPPSLSRAG